MGEPKIVYTPVVLGGTPTKVDLGKSPAIIPEGETPPADFKPPANETKGDDGTQDGGAQDAADDKSDDTTGDTGAKDASITAESGEDKGAEGDVGTQDAAKAEEEKTKRAAEIEAQTALLKKRFVQTQEESATLTRGQKKLKEDQKALDQKSELLKTKVDAYDNATRLAKEDPVKLIESLGVTYEVLTQAYLNQKDRADPAVANIQKEMDALNAEREKEKTEKVDADEKAVAAQQQATVDGYYDRLRKTVDKDDKYQLVKLQGDLAIKQAVEGAILYHQKHGMLPDDQELLAATEANLVKQTTDALGTEKFKKLFPGLNADAGDSGKSVDDKQKAGEADRSVEDAAETTEETAKATKTLSNKMQGEGGTRKGTGIVQDRDSSIAEASKGLKWG